MKRLIEVTVSPQGETTVQTKGYAGADCLAASRFLEQALGLVAAERKTAEYYQSAPVEQHVVALVCDPFPRASRDFRLYASDLLCKIHLDVTIQRVQELLPGETELAIRMNLCQALIDHFSVEGVEPARQLIKQHQLTLDIRRLRSSLLTYCKIMGTRFPEFDLWEAEARNTAQDERSKMKELQKMAYEAGGDLGLLVQKMRAKLAQEQRAPTGPTPASNLAPASRKGPRSDATIHVPAEVERNSSTAA